MQVIAATLEFSHNTGAELETAHSPTPRKLSWNPPPLMARRDTAEKATSRGRHGSVR
jgi:hypothetical protein